MTKKETLKLFEERKVRTVWDDEKEQCKGGKTKRVNMWSA